MALSTHTDGWAKLLEPGLRKIFFETWKEVPRQYSEVFNVENSSKHTEHDISLTGFGEWEPRTSEHSSIPYDDPMEGFEVNYTHTEFLKGFMVTRAMVDDEQYNQIRKLPKNLARTGRAKVETDAAEVLNNGFSNTGYDGVPLFSDQHPLKRSTQNGTNYLAVSGGLDNPEVLLSEDSVNQALVMARRTTDDAGFKIVVKPKYLIVPPELESQATKVVKSAQEPGTNQNDINTVRGKLNIIVMDYLTNANRFFLLDKDVASLMFFWRVRPEFKSTDDFDTLVAKYRGYMRYSVGYSNWRGIIGVEGVA